MMLRWTKVPRVEMLNWTKEKVSAETLFSLP